MQVLHVIVIILTLIVAVLLIGIVLIQKSKGGGLSSQFGGAGSVMGVRQTNSFLEKGTWWLAGIIVFLSVASAYTMPKMTTGAAIRSQQTNSMPVAPGANQFATPAVPDAQPAESAPVATEATEVAEGMSEN